MKKTEILGHQATHGPNTVFSMNYGHAIIDDIKADGRGTTRVFGRRVTWRQGDNGTHEVSISTTTTNWTLTQVDRVFATSIEDYTRIKQTHDRQTQERVKREEAQRELRAQAVPRLRTLLNNAGLSTFYNYRINQWSGDGDVDIKISARSLLTLLDFIDQCIDSNTQEVTA